MNKTTYFPEPFESFLKKKRIKTKFLKRIHQQIWKDVQLTGDKAKDKILIDDKTQFRLEFIKESCKYQSPISRAFFWKDAKEGDEYWYELNKEYKQLIN